MQPRHRTLVQTINNLGQGHLLLTQAALSNLALDICWDGQLLWAALLILCVHSTYTWRGVCLYWRVHQDRASLRGHGHLPLFVFCKCCLYCFSVDICSENKQTKRLELQLIRRLNQHHCLQLQSSAEAMASKAKGEYKQGQADTFSSWNQPENDALWVAFWKPPWHKYSSYTVPSILVLNYLLFSFGEGGRNFNAESVNL